MSKRTLPDELRSVLLAHSLDAPDPDGTVERILADTVAGRQVAEPAPRRRRTSVGLVGAAASVLLLVAGVGAIRAANHGGSNHADRGSAAAASLPSALSPSGFFNAPNRAQGSAAVGGDDSVQPPSPTDLNCPSSLPGSALAYGAQAVVQTEGQSVFVFEYYCRGVNGQRDGSQLEAFRRVGNQLQHLSTPVRASKGLHLQQLAGGVDGMTLTGTAADSSPSGALISLTLSTEDGGHTFDSSSHVITAACQAKDLSVKLSTVEQVSAADGKVVPGHLVLQLTNRTASSCVLEGYPSLVAEPPGAPLDQSLSGPAGGLIHSSTPPVIELMPKTTATALIESSPRHPACVETKALRVTLADGAALGSVPATILGCGATVHPFVNNPTGSD